MTARAKGRRDKNARIKRERNKAREIKKLREKAGMMDVDLVQPVKIDEKKQKEKLRNQVQEEFIEEMTQDIKQGEKIKVVNENTKKKHVYNTKTMKDQFGSYPVWYRANKVKRKQNKQKTKHKSNFWAASYMTLSQL